MNTNDMHTRGDGWTEADPVQGFEADALEVARRLFVDRGELPRLAYVEEPRGRVLFDLPVPHPSQPRLAVAVMRALSGVLEAQRATGVAQLAEAWVVTGTEAERAALPVCLADADNRREVVLVTVEHRDLDRASPRVWCAAIARDAEGRPTLGPWRRDGSTSSSGRMLGVLPRHGGPDA